MRVKGRLNVTIVSDDSSPWRMQSPHYGIILGHHLPVNVTISPEDSCD